MAAAPFGFSVGDFIAAIKLLRQVYSALQGCDGAAEHYQATMQDLEAIISTLQGVLQLDDGDTTSEIIAQARELANHCYRPIVAFLKKASKYEHAFNPDTKFATSKKRWLYKAHHKVGWSLWIKDDIAQLKAACSVQLATIQLLLQLSQAQRATQLMRKQNCILETSQSTQMQVAWLVSRFEAGASDIMDRRDSVTDDASSSRDQSELLFADKRVALRGTISIPSSTSEQQHLSSHKHSSLCRQPAYHKQPSCDNIDDYVTALMLYFWRIAMQIMEGLTIMPRTPSLLLGDNIQLIDALGRKLSLPYEHFRYWPVLMTRLESAFDGVAGELKVRHRNFGVFLVCGPQQVRLDRSNWERSVRPGAKVIMAFSIRGLGFAEDQCPRCGAQSKAPDIHGWTTCADCDLHHRLNRRPRPILLSSDQADAQAPVANAAPVVSVANTTPTGGRLVAESEIISRLREEEKDFFAFKSVQWVTFPCHRCLATFTLSSQLYDHLSERHYAEMYPTD